MGGPNLLDKPAPEMGYRSLEESVKRILSKSWWWKLLCVGVGITPNDHTFFSGKLENRLADERKYTIPLV
jgi:hypothetical protein